MMNARTSCLAVAVFGFASLRIAGAAATVTPTPVPSSAPCSAPEHAQFDFWIGDWDVANAGGQAAGRSRVSKILGGCVIHEEWKGEGENAGFDGESFSTYQPAEGAWRQTWVDSSGKHTDLRGSSPGVGSMSLKG